MKFTDEQQAVIDVRNCDLLVSAAAGSGKTAVLVERIIKRITGKDGTDIDRLLVVTFTRAAAAEMKERVRTRLRELMSLDPSDTRLARQEMLLASAQITTIDSFCQNILRGHFDEAGIDPSARVADDAQCKLMMQDCVEKLLEDEYAKGDAEFLKCMEYYSSGSDDSGAEEAILRLYRFADSSPWPEDWLREQDAGLMSGEDFESSVFCRRLMEDSTRMLSDSASELEALAERAAGPSGPYMYIDLLKGEASALRALSETTGYAGRSEAIRSFAFDRLPSRRDPLVDADEREYIKTARGNIKDIITGYRDKFFSRSIEDIEREEELSSGAERELIRLTLLFAQSYAKKKQELLMIDFSDMEHMALKLMLEKKEGEEDYTPTALAKQYRELFEEVMTDEYQDSNAVQELLLGTVAGKAPGKRFVVGDVKQSIYRFRQARPEIFMEKSASFDRYEDVPGKNVAGRSVRIDLHNNFRSRRQVTESVNFVFRRLMGTDLGGVEYDKDAELVYGADYISAEGGEDFTENDPWVTELIIFGSGTGDDAEGDADSTGTEGDDEHGTADTEDEAEDGSLMPSVKMSTRQQEAFVVAQRIHELMKDGKVTVRESDGSMSFRPVTYSDIVILLRANTGWDNVFKKVLSDEGIPVSVASGEGFFSSIEIMVLLQFLRILDNPLQDIPLASVMRSELFLFTDDELADIAMTDMSEHVRGSVFFYDRVTEYAKAGKKHSEHAAGFLERLSGYRDDAVYMPVEKLIRHICVSSGYLDRVSAMPGGSQRKRNIEELIMRAAEYEKAGFGGLFNFLRYVEKLEHYEIDYGTGSDGTTDSVRIMSIHKSKGLEFPYVFLCGTGKRFNVKDTGGRLIMDSELGLSGDVVDTERHICFSSMKGSIISDKLRSDTLGEELRILYVGMTRAREKLMITGVCGNADKALTDAARYADCDGLLPYMLRKKANSFLDWLLPAAGGSNGRIKMIRTDMKEAARMKKGRADSARLADRLMEKETGEAADVRYITERFSREYPFKNMEHMFAKTTVTERKEAALTDIQERSVNTAFPEKAQKPLPVPAFISRKEGLSGAERGTAYHRVMELLDRKVWGMADTWDDEAFSSWLSAQTESGRLKPEQAQAIDNETVRLFVSGELGRRMAKAYDACTLYRERPFMLGIPANEIDPAFPDSETVLIQGIIDAWFIENGEIVIADYKTDRVENGDELKRRYCVQLDLYQRAMEKITGLQVREKILYSIYLNRSVLT